MNKTTAILERGQTLNDIVFPGAKKEMSRAELRRALGPVLARWITSTCLWDDTAAIGDHRYVVFAIDVAPKVQVYVQFWSEPAEPVVWEVSSGRWNPPADKWLAGDRSLRIEAFGFEISGNAENFYREVEVRTPADATRIAQTVVDIFYAGFDYRWLRPIKAKMAYESRADMRFAYDSFTPEDLSKIFDGCGFSVEQFNDDEDAPALRAVRRGIVTTITCADRVPDQHLFQRAILTSVVEVPPEDARAAREAVERATGAQPDSMEVGTTLVFEGGVTVGWVMRRIQDWDDMTWSCRKDARRRRNARAKRQVGPVH
jgi:hypothetical protein